AATTHPTTQCSRPVSLSRGAPVPQMRPRSIVAAASFDVRFRLARILIASMHIGFVVSHLLMLRNPVQLYDTSSRPVDFDRVVGLYMGATLRALMTGKFDERSPMLYVRASVVCRTHARTHSHSCARATAGRSSL